MLAMHSKKIISFYFLSSFFSFFFFPLFSPLPLPPPSLFAFPLSTKIALKFESKERPRKPKSNKTKEKKTKKTKKNNYISTPKREQNLNF